MNFQNYCFPFDKPDTKLNGLLAKNQGPIRHKIEVADLERWRNASHEAFAKLGVDPATLDQVRDATHWVVSPEQAPQGTWFGEVLEAQDQGAPLTVIYRDALTTRLPGEVLFNFAAQSGMDHFYGHLVPFYKGEPWGEEAACRGQFEAALTRKNDPAWIITGGLVAVLQKLHKNIPLSNYRN